MGFLLNISDRIKETRSRESCKYLGSQVAENNRPLYPKVAHNSSLLESSPTAFGGSIPLGSGLRFLEAWLAVRRSLLGLEASTPRKRDTAQVGGPPRQPQNARVLH